MDQQANPADALTPSEERALRRDLSSWARRFLGLSDSDFDDVYQGAWRKVRELERQGRPTRNLNHALRWNMRNCWLEECRRRRRHPTMALDDCTDAALLQHAAPDVADEVERLEEAAYLLRAVGGMPDRRRRVLLLRDVWGLSSDEVCRVTGISERTYRRERAAALQQLFDELAATIHGAPSAAAGTLTSVATRAA